MVSINKFTCYYYNSSLHILATAGIISAQIEDQRIATTGGLDSSGEMEDVGITITLDDPTNVWLYYMYGATAASLPYSIFGTLAMIMIVNSIRKTRKDMKYAINCLFIYNMFVN